MTLLLIFSVVLIELLVVAWVDFKSEKIPNFWILVNLILSVLLHAAVPSLYPLSWEVLLFPSGFLVVGFFLFLLKIMGAGDSKFLASLFLVIPLEFHLLFFSKLVASTLIVGLVLLLMRVVKNGRQLKSYFLSHYWTGIRELLRSRFSYAPVILLAWLIMGANLWS